MSEIWREDHESYRNNLLDKLDVLFEAATLNYINNDKQMVEWLHGELDDETDCNAIRVYFANWASKRKVLVEKPLSGAEEGYSKSLFADEKEDIVFMVYLSDLFERDLAKDFHLEDCGRVSCLQFEVYKDGRIAMMYFGKAAEKSIDEDDEDYDDEDEVVVLMNGMELLGVECSEQGFEVHSHLSEIIVNELGFDYWVDDFRNNLNKLMDGYVKNCSENEM